jgi:hypothetical protein
MLRRLARLALVVAVAGALSAACAPRKPARAKPAKTCPYGRPSHYRK